MAPSESQAHKICNYTGEQELTYNLLTQKAIRFIFNGHLLKYKQS